MKQYDKVIKAEGDDPEDIWIRVGKQPPPFLVLTIEEAHDLFIAGMRRQRWVKEVLSGEIVEQEYPDFNNYLTSKGINTNGK